MPYSEDNRWSTGASGCPKGLLDGSPAAYAARWIDYGDVADIVPDRQGFAYNSPADRDRLIDALVTAEAHRRVLDIVRAPDESRLTVFDGMWMFARKAGGYIYVDAMTPFRPDDATWDALPADIRNALDPASKENTP